MGEPMNSEPAKFNLRATAPARGSVLLLVLALLAVPVVAIALAEPGSLYVAEAREFQRSTGGLGGGGILEPGWCFHAFDPRLESSCPTTLRPVPGVFPYCPHETTALFVHDL